MRQEYCILAESAQIYERGKAVIVGTFDTIYAPALPVTFRPFGVALRLAATKRSEHGKTYHATFSIGREKSTKPLLSADLEFELGKSTEGTSPSAMLTLQIPPITFDSLGTYVCQVKIGNRCVASTRLYVRPTDRGAASKARKKTEKKTQKKRRRTLHRAKS